jgi:hypothetical protein
MQGEAAHVRLVDHAVAQGPGQGTVSLPVEGVVHHNALGHAGGVGGRGEGQVRLRRGGVVAAGVGQVPGEAAREGLGVGVQQEAVGIETVPLQRLVRPEGPEQVELPCGEARHMDVPDVPRAVQAGVQHQLHRGGRILRVAEQQQVHGGGVPAEHGELHAVGGQRGAQRPRLAGAQPGGRGGGGAHCTAPAMSAGTAGVGPACVATQAP